MNTIYLHFRHDEFSTDILARLLLSMVWGGKVGVA